MTSTAPIARPVNPAAPFPILVPDVRSTSPHLKSLTTPIPNPISPGIPKSVLLCSSESAIIFPPHFDCYFGHSSDQHGKKARNKNCAHTRKYWKNRPDKNSLHSNVSYSRNVDILKKYPPESYATNDCHMQKTQCCSGIAADFATWYNYHSNIRNNFRPSSYNSNYNGNQEDGEILASGLPVVTLKFTESLINCSHTFHDLVHFLHIVE